MTINTQTGISSGLVGDGVNRVFPFDFMIGSIVELVAYIDGVQVSPSDFTVNHSEDWTGDVTFDVAPANGAAVTLASDPAFVQSSVHQRQGPFFPDIVEDDLDKATLRDIYLRRELARTLKLAFGETGPDLPAAAIRAGKMLAFDASGDLILATPSPGTDAGLRSDLAANAGSTLVKFLPKGTGAVARNIQVKNRETISVKDYGAVGDGSVDDTAAINAALVALRGGMSDPTGRLFAGKLFFPDGLYRVNSPIQAAPTGGVTGLTLEGTGPGSSAFKFTHPTATFQAQSSRDVTIRNMGFQGSAVDDNQTAITVPSGANPLRSWAIEHCDFSAFRKVFNVTGSTLCSEFYMSVCRFVQCYELMYNDNIQAVNWNFLNCDWENESVVTSLNKNLAAMFHLRKGTFVNWSGGSFVLHGMMVYYDLISSGAFQKTSHKMNFSGVRIELEDDGAGGHAPLIDRVASGYTNGSNTPSTSLEDFDIINRGAIPNTVVYAKAWGGCTLNMSRGETEGGKVVGVLDGVTAASPANIHLEGANLVTYEQDITARVNTHDTHNVTIIPNNVGAGVQPVMQRRLASLTAPATRFPAELDVTGPTGSIPLAGTTVPIGTFLDNTFFTTLRVERRTTAGQSLTVLLRDLADTTTYATLTIGVGVTNASVYVGKEMGTDIPTGTQLMLKQTGTAEIVKGSIILGYRG